jgi:hypothetical protein
MAVAEMKVESCWCYPPPKVIIELLVHPDVKKAGMN